MKKYFLVIMMFLLLTGCSSKNTTPEEKEEKNPLESKKAFSLKCDLITDDILYVGDYYCDNEANDSSCVGKIMTKKHLYEYSPFGLFSENNQQCREINITLDDEEEWYYLYTGTDMYSNKYEYRYNGNSNLERWENSDYSYDEYKKELEQVFNNINIKLDKDEQIIKVKYSTEYSGIRIKTNKGIYYVKQNITNKKECETYTDIKCEYEYNLKKVKISDEIIDSIIAFNEVYVIDSNLNFYQY